MSEMAQLKLLPYVRLVEDEVSPEGFEIIRFPKRGRDALRFRNNLVVVGKGENRFALEIKPAFKEDVIALNAMVKAGTISMDEAETVAFVSRNLLDRITRLRGGSVKSLWVTDGVEDVTTGADPEFGLITTDPKGDKYLVPGNSVLPKRGKFGSDGPGVEVRPAPSRDYRQVIANIKEILSNPPDVTKAYEWIGGATYRDKRRTYWFGGHIHFGRPLQILPSKATSCFRSIAAVLDAYLSFPLVRFDKPEPNLRRNGCSVGYGKAQTNDSIRADYDTTCSRFEYRVPSGLWLVHPTLAKAVMGTAKCVVEAAYRRMAGKNFDYNWISAHTANSLVGSFNIPNYPEIVSIINGSETAKITAQHLMHWKAQLKNLETYPQYKREVDCLLAITETPPNVVVPDLCLDLRANWIHQQSLLPHVNLPLVRTAIEALEAS